MRQYSFKYVFNNDMFLMNNFNFLTDKIKKIFVSNGGLCDSYISSLQKLQKYFEQIQHSNYFNSQIFSIFLKFKMPEIKF